MKLLIILFGFLCVLSGRFKDDDEPVHVRYILLDRNSSGIHFLENPRDSTFVKMISRSWYVKRRLDTVARHEEGISFHFNTKYQYRDMIKRKPRSFLDSVHYYNEDWVRDSFPFDSVPSWVYLLDEGTIRGDSMVMYRTAGGGYMMDYD